MFVFSNIQKICQKNNSICQLQVGLDGLDWKGIWIGWGIEQLPLQITMHQCIREEKKLLFSLFIFFELDISLEVWNCWEIELV